MTAISSPGLISTALGTWIAHSDGCLTCRTGASESEPGLCPAGLAIARRLRPEDGMAYQQLLDWQRRLRHLLVVDDDPGRYEALFELARANRVVVTITDHPDAVRMYLQGGGLHPSIPLVGVCLDHDMAHMDGARFAEDLFGDLSVPVAITSANDLGAVRITATLDARGVDNRHFRPPDRKPGERAYRVVDHDWALRVLDWLLKPDRARSAEQIERLLAPFRSTTTPHTPPK